MGRKKSVEENLRKLAAMAFLAAADERSGRKPSRAPQMLDFILEWVERDEDLAKAVLPELERLGKQLGFEVKAATHGEPSKEKH